MPPRSFASKQADHCGSVGRERKIETIDVPFYLPARGPVQGKAGGLFVSRGGTRRGGRPYGRYGESSIRLEMHRVWCFPVSIPEGDRVASRSEMETAPDRRIMPENRGATGAST